MPTTRTPKRGRSPAPEAFHAARARTAAAAVVGARVPGSRTRARAARARAAAVRTRARGARARAAAVRTRARGARARPAGASGASRGAKAARSAASGRQEPGAGGKRTGCTAPPRRVGPPRRAGLHPIRATYALTIRARDGRARAIASRVSTTSRAWSATSCQSIASWCVTTSTQSARARRPGVSGSDASSKR